MWVVVSEMLQIWKCWGDFLGSVKDSIPRKKLVGVELPSHMLAFPKSILGGFSQTKNSSPGIKMWELPVQSCEPHFLPVPFYALNSISILAHSMGVWGRPCTEHSIRICFPEVVLLMIVREDRTIFPQTFSDGRDWQRLVIIERAR